jgi:hypothetical protein
MRTHCIGGLLAEQAEHGSEEEQELQRAFHSGRA